MRFTLTLPYTPPSLNRHGRAHPMAQHRHKTKLQADLEIALMEAAVPRGLERVVATAVLFFPLLRRRDEGNHRWLLEKALGDALTNGRWLPDDTPDRYTFPSLAFDAGKPRTVVCLECS